MSPSIRRRTVIPYVIFIVVAMLAIGTAVSSVARETGLDTLEARLDAQARLIADALTQSSAWYDSAGNLDPLARKYADLLGVRVTIVASDGSVLGESGGDRTEMDNHRYRPEVQGALNAGRGVSVRHSPMLGYEMVYVALPVTSGGRVRGVVRVALPSDLVEADVARVRWTVFWITLVAVACAGGLAYLVGERTARPVRRLTRIAQRVAGGDLSARILPVSRDEVGALTQAFNRMTDRLRDTITTLSEEESRLTAVLDNMADGVLITDGDGYVRLLNPAAARLLGTDEESALDRSFAEVARDHRVIDLWRQSHTRNTERIEPVELDRRGPFLQVVVTPLKDAGPQASLVILQDLTRVRRLETIRRDLLSNISHELRTPLASLRALVDTLRDGALEDPPAARRFLDRMETEVEALAQMVQELLELSRIESGQVPLRLKPVSVADVVTPPVERLRPQAERAGLRLSIQTPPDSERVLVDAERIGQALTNLVHNAIKFTPPGGKVTVLARPSRDEVVIAVEDTGVGVAEDDLPRIFERFYKADRARSGGGTGLGLAIAKHIVLAHKGRIWAESVEGQGSSFYIALPALTHR